MEKRNMLLLQTNRPIERLLLLALLMALIPLSSIQLVPSSISWLKNRWKKYLCSMSRIKNVFVLVHIFLWIVFGMLAALQLSQSNSNWPVLITSFMLTCLYVFYSHFFLLTRYPGKNNRSTYFPGLLAILLTGPLIYLLFPYRTPQSPNSFFEQYVIYMMTFGFPFLFLGWLARITENLVINTVKKEQLEKQAVESELHYLKSQVNPHFLFNTLNNIHTLVYKQASTAPAAVMQLASLMRYMIYESNAATVPLEREINYLQDYIGLQQLRYRNAEVVDLEIVGDIASCYVAPLLFIHLLENAYKHSPASLEPGDFKVRITVENDVLSFSVENPVNKKSTLTLEEPGGIGLPNVRKRLALLYPDQHTLEIKNEEGTFAIILKIHGLKIETKSSRSAVLRQKAIDDFKI